MVEVLGLELARKLSADWSEAVRVILALQAAPVNDATMPGATPNAPTFGAHRLACARAPEGIR
jgi:hypothetical protein